LLGLSGYRVANDSAFFARRRDQICILGVPRFDVEMQVDDKTKNDKQSFHLRTRSPLGFKLPSTFDMCHRSEN
jgi:CDP-glycerol glycerophosphotransferase (TagB/SpsB family)